jgi:hypothetical protein
MLAIGSDTGNGSLNGRMTDYVIFDHGLGSTDRATLLTWAQTRGVQASYTNAIAFDGDSISTPVACTMNRAWIKQANIPVATRQLANPEPSITLATCISEAATFIDAYLVAGKTNVLAVWLGTNDFAVHNDSEATVRANVKSYCASRKSAGWDKVLYLGTLPRPIANTFTDANVFNAGGFMPHLEADFDAGAGIWNVDGFCELHHDPTIGGTIANGNNTNLTNYNADQTHLNNAGEAFPANMVVPFISPWLAITPASYAITGGASGGTVSVASAPFTCALVGGCTFNGTQSIVIRDLSGSGTFTMTAPGGTITNNGTATVTVRPAAGQTGFTFTYTPGTNGAKTISPLGYSGGAGTPVNRGWTDAGNQTYTATGGGGGGHVPISPGLTGNMNRPAFTGNFNG